MTRQMHFDIIHQPMNRLLWFTLAFQGGAINVSGFLAIHRFVSHVTGFSALFSTNLYEGNFKNALFAILVPFFFLLGSFFTGLFSTRKTRTPISRFFFVFLSLGLIFFAIAFCGHTGLFGNFGEEFSHTRDFVLLILLSFSMGSQNAIVTHYSSSIVRTTHLTGITTDLGIGLARIFNQTSLHKEAQANWLRAGLILFFLFGSLFGVNLFLKFEFLGYTLFGALNLSIAVFYLLHKKRRKQ